MTMDRLAIAGAIALAMLSGCTSGPKPAAPVTTAEVTRDPGKSVEVTETVTAQAKVVSVNQKTRMVTLENADGDLIEFRADDRVKNLPQVKKGDMVTAVYQRAIAATLMPKGSKKVGTHTAEGVLTAAPGEKPAALGGKTVTVETKVTKVNREKSEVTLKGPKGKSVTVAVKDQEAMKKVAVGDIVQIEYTEALLLSVDAPK